MTSENKEADVQERKEDEISEDEETEEEEEDSDDDDDDDSEVSLYEAIGDFKGQENGDLSFKSGDILSILAKRKDGWWTAENNKRNVGLVPSTYLKPHLEFPEEDAKELRSSSPEEKVTEKIENPFTNSQWNYSMPLPCRFQNEGIEYSLSSFLKPKLSSTGLSFRDLNWDGANNRLRLNPVRCQRIFTLSDCQYIPISKTDAEIFSCHLNVCLHDGTKVLSNIYTVHAKWEAKDPQNWTFLSSISQNGTYIEDGKVFVRTTDISATIGVLFQPCFSYRMSKTGEKGELSCGWSFMRLLDDSGMPVPNKTKILHIHEGNPFEKGVASTTLTAGKSGLKTLISKNRRPRLVVRISTPDRETRQQLDFLPDVLIGPVSLLSLIALYRQLLADCLLEQQNGTDSTELIHCPVESTFPKLFDQPAILDAFKKSWLEKLRTEKRSIKKDTKRLKELFKQVYMETAYFLLHCANLPLYNFGNIYAEEVQKKEINRLMQIRYSKGPLHLATAHNIPYKPFCIDELALNIVDGFALSTS